MQKLATLRAGVNDMKKATLSAVFILILFFALWKSGADRPTALAEHVKAKDLVRLHVIANSDTSEDQAVKLKVRDAVLDVSRAWLQDVQDKRDALDVLGAHKKELTKAAEKRLRELDQPADVCVVIGQFDFPDRIYDGVLVPAGTYDAVRVVIGEGKGTNWWCVMYPSLCLETETAVTAPEVKFESAVVKWVRTTLGL